jgi:hypothetical protein
MGGVLVALVMVLLTRVDGGQVAVIPAQVTSLHAAAGSGPKVIIPGARCVVWLTDGRVLSVIEPCDMVRRMLEEAAAK